MLHLYPSEVRIEGLETLDYLDNLSQREWFTEQGDAITFEAEVPSSTLIYAFSYKDEFICEKACYCTIWLDGYSCIHGFAHQFLIVKISPSVAYSFCMMSM